MGAWTLVDLSLTYKVLKGLSLNAAVNNAFNTMPPVDHSQTGDTNQPYNELNYNVYGRTFYLTATYKMGK